MMLGVKGYGFITSTGHDPDQGKNVKDPHWGATPSLGACRPDLRQKAVPGDHFFVVSGKVPKVDQYVIGVFEVAEKIHAREAYKRFPGQRLYLRDDGQLAGNVIIDVHGNQHPLDRHRSDTFERRTENYIVGRNAIMLSTPDEIARGREDSLYFFKNLLGKSGDSMFKIFGRQGVQLDAYQVQELRAWLLSLKSAPLLLHV